MKFLTDNKLFTLTAKLRFFSTVDSATIPLTEYKLFKLENSPPTETTLTREDAIDYYTKMQFIRRMETSIGNLYKEKKIRGFCHLYSGQEAVAVGLKAPMTKDDSLITAYRCHAFTYLFDNSIESIIAELCGRREGCAKGIGGSMHMYGKNFYGGNGIVGAQVPLGAGVALKHLYKKDNSVCFSLYGDGAANQGQVFEAYNISKLWNLPVVYVCENNKYGMGTSVERASANINYYRRGDYIPGIWVDGMDVLTVREASRFVTEWCRSGMGPILMETETYRYHGHSMSDPGTSYRTRDEIQSMRKDKDPISAFSKTIIAHNLVTEDELKEIDKKIRTSVDKDVERAVAQPEPELGAAYKHIYSKDGDKLVIRGCDNFSWEKSS